MRPTGRRSARGTYLFDVETGPCPLEPDRVHSDRRYAPADPVSDLVFTRVIYLTDWAQETLGELNAAAGCIAPCWSLP